MNKLKGVPMDYTNYQNPSFTNSTASNDIPTTKPVTVRTIETNRSETNSTEQRLFGAYRNTDQAVQEPLTPVSTPDAPLIYPLDDTPDTNETTQPNDRMGNDQMSLPNDRRSVPLPSFINQPRTDSNNGTMDVTPRSSIADPVPMPRPMNGNAYPGSYYYYQTNPSSRTTMPMTPMNLASPIGRGKAYMQTYQQDQNYSLYLPNQYPLYNFPSNGYESLNDFEEAERDMEYLKQLYPHMCQLLQSKVDDACDQLEYEGSFMFDEYPDKTTFDRIIHRIYGDVKDYNEIRCYDEALSKVKVSANQLSYAPCNNCNMVEDFIRILFLNEMHNRRRRYRSRRRWFY